MGCTNTTVKKSFLKQNTKNINFTIKVNSVKLNFICDQNTLNIKGYFQSKTKEQSQKQKLIYDTYYDDISLPEQVYKCVKSVKLLVKNIEQFREELQISNNNLVITIKGKKLILPLISNEQQKQIQLQSLVTESIKKITQKQKTLMPFNSAVLIISHCGQGITIQGSGAIIQNSTILTVAHNVYNRTHEIEASKIFVYVWTSLGLKQLKVKKHYFPVQYKTINQTDLPKYDFAYLELEKNTIIKSSQILPIKWDWIDSYSGFQVVGFSSKLDKQFQQKDQNQYSLKCGKAISVFQNFIVYDNKAESGISGGPIIIQEGGVFKLIGLHQGFHKNFSRGILLSSFGKNAFQILTQMSSFNQQLKNKLNPLQARQQQQKQLLRIQNQKLKKERQEFELLKQKNQHVKLSKQKENQNLKKQIQKLQQLLKKKQQYLKINEKTNASPKTNKGTNQKINEQLNINTLPIFQQKFKKGKQLFHQRKFEESQCLLNQCLELLSDKRNAYTTFYIKTLDYLSRIHWHKINHDYEAFDIYGPCQIKQDKKLPNIAISELQIIEENQFETPSIIKY